MRAVLPWARTLRTAGELQPVRRGVAETALCGESPMKGEAMTEQEVRAACALFICLRFCLAFVVLAALWAAVRGRE